MMFRTCFFRLFSSIIDQEHRASIANQKSQLIIMIMFSMIIKKKIEDNCHLPKCTF